MNWKANFTQTIHPLTKLKMERRRKIVEITKEIEAYKTEHGITHEEFAVKFPEIMNQYNKLRALDEVQA